MKDRSNEGPRNASRSRYDKRLVQFDLQKLLFAFRRRTSLFFAVLAGMVCIELVATSLSEPLYRADAEVVLGGERDAGEFALIRSSSMAARVATALHLEADPEFAGAHDLTHRLHSLFGRPEGHALRPATTAHIIDRLRRNLSVVRPANTLALTISYTAADASTAARIANAYALAYTGSSPASVIGAGDEHPDNRIISSASLPLVPISPRPFVSLVIAILIGTVLGFGAAVLSEMRFAGLTSGADVRDRLFLPHLGSVPTLASVMPNARSAIDAVIEFPMSAFAETFRNLWLAIQSNGGERPQVVAIASTLPDEGKTTIAVGLARTLALRGERVVLIDCDARRSVSAALGSAVGGAGLEDVLGGRAALDDALVRDDRSGAFLLPNTRSPETPTDLLDSPEMSSLIDDLRGRFRHVFIAIGPLGTSTGSQNIAVLADTLVVVIRWRTTKAPVIAAALKQLRGQRVQIAGAVLTQVDMRKQVKYSADEATIYQQQFLKYYS